MMDFWWCVFHQLNFCYVRTHDKMIQNWVINFITFVLVFLSIHVMTYCWTTPLACWSLKTSYWKVTLVDVVSMTLKLLGGTFGGATRKQEMLYNYYVYLIYTHAYIRMYILCLCAYMWLGLRKLSMSHNNWNPIYSLTLQLHSSTVLAQQACVYR